MRNTVIKILLFFGILFISGCSREQINDYDDGLPYYQFTQDEKTKLIIAPKVNDQIIYKNQDGEVIIFKVRQSETGKTVFSTGNFASSYSTKHFYYDRQIISMWYVEGYFYTKCDINIQKFPIGSNYQINPLIVGTPKFYGYFEFPLWNGYNGTDIYDNYISINFDNPTITMTFNGKTYSKVRVFESNKLEVLSSNNNLPFRPKNVNIIYYDYNYGIIGFDDLNGKLWRLQ